MAQEIKNLLLKTFVEKDEKVHLVNEKDDFAVELSLTAAKLFSPIIRQRFERQEENNEDIVYIEEEIKNLHIENQEITNYENLTFEVEDFKKENVDEFVSYLHGSNIPLLNWERSVSLIRLCCKFQTTSLLNVFVPNTVDLIESNNEFEAIELIDLFSIDWMDKCCEIIQTFINVLNHSKCEQATEKHPKVMAKLLRKSILMQENSVTSRGDLLGSTSTTSTSVTGGLFGSTSTSTSTTSVTGGLFGSTSTTPVTGGLFGSTSTSTTSVTGGMFGSTSTASVTGRFYGFTSTTPVTGGLFGSTTKTPVAVSDETLDGVIICTVTNAHEDYVKKCISARKPMFCEKPIAENLKDTVSCYEAAKTSGVPLFCAFNRRFDATHSAVKEACDKGEVGKIHMVKVCSRDSPLLSASYLKISGGIYHDCAVHDIDMAMWMLKDRPVSVFSHAHAFRDFIGEMNDVDTVSITMKFPSGAIALVDLSRFACYGYDQRVEVFGEHGMLESLNENKTNVRKSTQNSVCQDLYQFSFPQRYEKGYEKELEHFLQIIEGGECMITQEDVAWVSLVASACEESHKTGKHIKIDSTTLSYQPM